jgi:hypothetical protein
VTPLQAKVAIYGGLALLAWLFTERGRRAVVGDVDLGIGIVNGIAGGDYQTPRPNGSNPAVNPTMRDLIDESNAAIAADRTVIPY